MERARENLVSYLEDFLDRGDATAFSGRSGLRRNCWSYRKIAESSIRLAGFLAESGITDLDRVLIRAGNSPEWVVAFFGCLLRGAVVVPLDEQSSPEFILRVQAQVRAKLILVDEADSLPAISGCPALGLGVIEDLIGKYPAGEFDPTGIGPDHLAEIIFTSGTTAEPKGVCLTHRNLLANLVPLEREIRRFIWLERPFHPLRFLSLLPLSHVFGQFMGMLVPQLLGGEVHFMESRNPAEIISMIRGERINVVSAVPRQLDTLRHRVEIDLAERGELESFRCRFERAEGRHFLRRWWSFRDMHRLFGWRFLAFITGGATLDPGIESFWQRMSFAVIQGYGMTETASIVSVNHPFKSSRGSIGRILPGHEVRIDDSGEIMVRGENISAGYWQDGIRPLAADEGWWRTGDMAVRDDEGNLFFRGRKKDVIVTAAGLNIFPEDLEAALKAQPGVRDSCVFGIETAHGPEPMAVLLLGDGGGADPARIVRGANQRLNISQHIRHWRVWNEADFPRTPTHKIRKGQVRDRILAGAPAGSHAVTSGESIEDLIAAVTGGSRQAIVDRSALGSDLKLDSLGRVALLSALEDRYQVELDESTITGETTVADLQNLIRRQSREAIAENASTTDYPYPYWALRSPLVALRSILYWLLVVPFLAVMCWPRVKGRECLRGIDGPALFVSNHVSMVDPAMIMRALPWRFRRRLTIAMAGERLRAIRNARDGSGFWRFFDPVRYLLVVAVFNVFSLPQRGGFRRSFSYAGKAMDNGFNVLVFPEGKTTEDGRMNPFMSGIGMLAEELRAPVVPVKIEGLFDLKKQRRYFSPPGTVTVSFGETIRFEPEAGPAAITARLEQAVRGL